MKYGSLNFLPVEGVFELVAPTTKLSVQEHKLQGVLAAPIDPALADTAAFCAQYGVDLGVSANCVIVKARRVDKVSYAAVMVLAIDRADINGVIRHILDARKISFAPMDEATSLTAMEFGGINPIGLPAEWPILIDQKVAAQENVVIGSGLRTSKLLVSGELLARLPSARVLDLIKH